MLIILISIKTFKALAFISDCTLFNISLTIFNYSLLLVYGFSLLKPISGNDNSV